MANLVDTPVWETGVFQIEVDTRLLGGQNGPMNTAPQQLTNRTAWLKGQIESLSTVIENIGSTHTHDASAIVSGILATARLGSGAASNATWLRGDGTWQIIDGFAPTNHTQSATTITSGVLATARLGSGTADATSFLRGDQTWAALSTVASTGAYADLTGKPTIPSVYTLPIATSTILGGVKQGSGLTIDVAGVISLNAQPYDIPMFHAGVPANTAVLGRVNIPRAVTLPANLTGSLATSEVAATASTVLTIKKGTTTLGTITFAVGATTGTFTFATQQVLDAGDILYVYNASTADTTLADISITLVGTR